MVKRIMYWAYVQTQNDTNAKLVQCNVTDSKLHFGILSKLTTYIKEWNSYSCETCHVNCVFGFRNGFWLARFGNGKRANFLVVKVNGSEMRGAWGGKRESKREGGERKGERLRERLRGERRCSGGSESVRENRNRVKKGKERWTEAEYE